jgi:RHS repeat-associated protein
VSQAFNAANGACWTYVGTSSNACGSAPTGSNSYTWDANGNLTAENLANGINNTYSYDDANYMKTISDGTSGAVFKATYTRTGNNLIATDNSQPSNQDYKYTSKNQVCYAGTANSSACTSPPTGAYPYTYDAAGNATSFNGNTQAFSSAAGATDELCWSVSGATTSLCSGTPTGRTTYTYNTNGDRTAATPSSGSASAYTFNALSQMTGYQLGSGTAYTYAYDGNGLRQEKTGSSSTYYDWSDSSHGGTPSLLEEVNGTNTTTYVYGPAGPIEEILPSGATYYYSYDGNGSTRAVTDSSGTVQDTETYDPYGNATTTGSVQNNLLFGGQYLDSESGLYYLRARYMDPTTGQFLSVDPDVAVTGQPYSFTNGDPVNGSDPTGLHFIYGDGIGSEAGGVGTRGGSNPSYNGDPSGGVSRRGLPTGHRTPLPTAPAPAASGPAPQPVAAAVPTSADNPGEPSADWFITKIANQNEAIGTASWELITDPYDLATTRQGQIEIVNHMRALANDIDARDRMVSRFQSARPDAYANWSASQSPDDYSASEIQAGSVGAASETGADFVDSGGAVGDGAGGALGVVVALPMILQWVQWGQQHPNGPFVPPPPGSSYYDRNSCDFMGGSC